MSHETAGGQQTGRRQTGRVLQGSRLNWIIRYLFFYVKMTMHSLMLFEETWKHAQRFFTHWMARKSLPHTVTPWGQDCASVATRQHAAEQCHPQPAAFLTEVGARWQCANQTNKSINTRLIYSFPFLLLLFALSSSFVRVTLHSSLLMEPGLRCRAANVCF